VGVALLSVAVGGAGAWGTWAAAEQELRNRADTSVRVLEEALVTQRVRLEREAFLLADTRNLGEALTRASGDDLADLGVSTALSNRFDYVAVAGPGGVHVLSDRTIDWSILREPALLEKAATGVPDGGVAVAGDGTPVVFTAVPVRIPGARNGVVIIGDPVTPVMLEEVVRPLDLTFELRTTPQLSVNSLAGAADHRRSVRTFRYPMRVADVSSGPATLFVGLSTAPLQRATASAALIAAVVACVSALSLLLLVEQLLGRAVLRPLRHLRSGIVAVEQGRYDVALAPGGARELADIAAGFQRMAAMVGEQQARLRDQAARDPLTGLANHASFHAELTSAALRAQHGGEPLAVLMLDVDHFKQINDRHGHPFGDGILRTVAEQLMQATRDTDTAARLGGDEFAVLLRGAGPTLATAIAQRLCGDLCDLPVSGERLSVSIGVACFPEHTSDATTLIEVADRALYAAKRGGRGRALASRAPAPDTDAAPASPPAPDAAPPVPDDRTLVLGLLAQPDAVVSVFQPVVALHGGTVVGYEALARFPADSGSPETWFARAHRCGLGPELEARALVAALATNGRPQGFLALNVSPSALLSAEVEAVLPADLTGLVVEVTEHEAVTDPQALRSRLQSLRDRGARIALDDAGSGYAGLQQLLHVQPEIIKLDRSLVDGVDRDSERQAMVAALVGYARHAGALVCGEGVETLAEARTLAALGVDLGQGYGLARPGVPWPVLAAPVEAELTCPPAGCSTGADGRQPGASTTPVSLPSPRQP